MQINNNGITNNTTNNNRQKTVEQGSSGGDNGQNSSPAVDRDSVQLSREAQVLKKLEAQILASPDVDVARVASIRQAIADGSYEINAESVALKMLDSDGLF